MEETITSHSASLRTRLLLLGLLVLAASPLAQSQEPLTGGFGDTVLVEVVNVEVFVTTRDGTPVTGLTRDDFRIFEDGTRVEITHFAAYEGRAAGAAVDVTAPQRERSATPAADPAHLVLFIDNVNTGPRSRARVLGQVWNFVNEQLGPADEVMVVSYDPSLTVHLPFSRDRKKLREALIRVESTIGQRLTADLEERQTIELIHDLQRRAMAGQDGAFRPCPWQLGVVARAFATQEYHQIRGTVATLTSFVDSLAGYPGRKAILHVSDGIPLKAGATPYQVAIELCDGTAMAQGVPHGYDVFAEGRSTTMLDPAQAAMDQEQFDTSRAWSQLAAHANAHRISFYTVQASGLQGQRSISAASPYRLMSLGAENLDVANEQDTLFMLADETGGRAMLNTNDFGPGLGKLAADLGTYYHLGYRPPQSADGMTHRIRVEVSRPGVRVRHRKGYQSKTPHQQVADRVLSCLYHEVGTNPLGIRAELSPPAPADGKKVKARLRLRVPLARLTLLPMPPVHSGVISVFVAVRDDQGALSPVRESTTPVRVASDRLEIDKDRDFLYDVEMLMRSGEHRVAVAVRDEINGRTSYLRQTFKVSE